MGVRMAGERLEGLEFLPPDTPLRDASGSAARVAAELEAYYANPNHVFDLPLHPAGTPFRQRVWQAIAAIPPGRTRGYGDLARELGSSPRAVGQAVGDNPLPIAIPCHRVIARDGGLGGFNHCRAGFALDVKRWLLSHEGVL